MDTESIAILNNSLGTVVINNKTFLVSQPKRSDIFSFWKYSRDAAKSSFSIKDKVAELADLPEDIRKPLINVLIIEAKSEPTPALLWEYMASPKCVAFLMYLLVKGNQDVKLEDLEALININNVDEVLVDLEDACGMRVITENLKTDPTVSENFPKPQVS